MTLCFGLGLFEVRNFDAFLIVMAEFSYKTSGVEEIEGDALKGSFDIYDIAGVAVMRGATRSDLRNLKKGIYIINGKKVII